MSGQWERLGFVGARSPRPTGWKTQPLPCDTARCGLTNPQHRGIIPCFLKQVFTVVARFIGCWRGRSVALNRRRTGLRVFNCVSPNKRKVASFYEVTILCTISICFMSCFQVFADFSFSFFRELNSQKKDFRYKQ